MTDLKTESEPLGAPADASSAEQAARLLQQGRKAEAQALIQRTLDRDGAGHDPQLHLLACNAFAGSPREQLRRLNAYLAAHGLPELALLDPEAPPSPTNLRPALVQRVVENGPLVSVLMTAYNAAGRLQAAMRSVLDQTWRNLELIVVDDASDDDTLPQAQALARTDERVRVLRLPRNAGTYVAKHVALQHARGEFVTCHDSDDWSLPAKIERQVAPLLKDRRLVASTSCWVRIQDDGTYYARQVFPLRRLNPSSLLFRREPVLSRAGAWDPVRTGADSEFLERLKIVFGREAVHRLSEPLSLGSHRPGSLMTAQDTGYTGGLSATRQAYWDAWNAWHAAVLRRRARPWMPANAALAAQWRPFPVPPELVIPLGTIAQCIQAVGDPGFMADASGRAAWVACSGTISAIPVLGPLLGGTVRRARIGMERGRLSAVLAWGRKPSAERAERTARKLQLPVLRVEDGFLRSFGTGDVFPPLSLVFDDTGIYYDSTRASALESLLNETPDPCAGLEDEVARAKKLLQTWRLGKYNHASAAPRLEKRHATRGAVLVVDQTRGDLSVSLGGADAATFQAMLAAARSENPDCTIYVKTHPETSAGRKGGYLTDVQPDERTVVLRGLMNPLDLVEQVDRVYVVSSTLGFEALLAGKRVTCFGLPWYAGWGATDDRQSCPRRRRRHGVDGLFAAAYLHYARYIDPETGERGTVFDAIDWLVRQKQVAERMRGPAGTRRLVCIDLRRRNAASLQPLLAGAMADAVFVPDAESARAVQPGPDDWLVFWGTTPPGGVEALAQSTGSRTVRLADGFVRSVGLGSDLVAPRSLVLDTEGLYFDPSRPSGLETVLNTGRFSAQEIEEARNVRAFIVEHGLTLLNLEARGVPVWPHQGRRVVLVPGQVEDDASIRLGCGTVRTDLGLLQAVRAACPDAFIVYKPHPDLSGGHRQDRLRLQDARRWADHVETEVSVVGCIGACDEVHTMTSLTGFDALLREKPVVVYGQPFYAGWGLTRDVLPPEEAAAFARRRRRLTLDELVAGTLLRYPLYWDPELKGYTTCMATLRRIAAERDALERSGGLKRLRKSWWRRQARKARFLLAAWTRSRQSTP